MMSLVCIKLFIIHIIESYGEDINLKNITNKGYFVSQSMYLVKFVEICMKRIHLLTMIAYVSEQINIYYSI